MGFPGHGFKHCRHVHTACLSQRVCHHAQPQFFVLDVANEFPMGKEEWEAREVESRRRCRDRDRQGFDTTDTLTTLNLVYEIE